MACRERCDPARRSWLPGPAGGAASHREINAWVNREVGARSAGAATLQQLERANAVPARRVGR